MQSFQLDTIPDELTWLRPPVDQHVDEQGLMIKAGALTDWFIDPAGKVNASNAPVALFTPPAGDFVLQARVAVDFGATYDAGVIFIYGDDSHWAKVCFEYSPQNEPMVVSVVTRDSSDDCNSVVIDGHEVYLRISRNGPAWAFHYSRDGRTWRMVRYFKVHAAETRIGFSAQSPTGDVCEARFTEIAWRPGGVADIRSGV